MDETHDGSTRWEAIEGEGKKWQEGDDGDASEGKLPGFVNSWKAHHRYSIIIASCPRTTTGNPPPPLKKYKLNPTSRSIICAIQLQVQPQV